ncbi:hypothetical protein ACTFIW_008724 [Dictyostelium discoideum]
MMNHSKNSNNLKKEFERENIVSIPIGHFNSTPIDIENVKASTDIQIHSDNNNLNNGCFQLYSKGDRIFLSIIDSQDFVDFTLTSPDVLSLGALDCHNLPIKNEIEKVHELSIEASSIEAFRIARYVEASS